MDNVILKETSLEAKFDDQLFSFLTEKASQYWIYCTVKCFKG